MDRLHHIPLFLTGKSSGPAAGLAVSYLYVNFRPKVACEIIILACAACCTRTCTYTVHTLATPTSARRRPAVVRCFVSFVYVLPVHGRCACVLSVICLHCERDATG